MHKLHKSRILMTVAAMMLVGGTMFVAAEGTGPAPAQPGAEPKGGAEPKAAPKTVDPKAKNGGPEKSPPPKSAEPREKAPPMGDKADPKPAPKGEKADPKPMPKEKADPKPMPKGEKGEKADPKGPKTGEKPAATDKGTTKITTEQRTEIRQTIIKQGKGPRVTNVNFNVSIGTSVPRNVQVAVLPARVFEIYPVWRGYRYFIVDDRIIIIDDGWRIVFIIED